MIRNTISLFCFSVASSMTYCRCFITRRSIFINAVKMTMNAERKSKFTVPQGLGTKVHPDEVKRYIVDCMSAVGTTTEHARAMGDLLCAADRRGHYSHGLNRLEMYINDVEKNICDGKISPKILKESQSTALVDGQNGLGPVVGNFCMNLAMEKAKETGIGWIAARGSNHYGIAGWYAMQASAKGYIGMSFTNTSPLVAPTRAKQRFLGTNPIAVAAPAKTEDFVLDMATSGVALGKIELQRRKEEPVPEGWAIDVEGNVTTDASKAAQGALMPLGGSEIHSGYKGYGLAMMVEVFCGMLSGGHYGPNVRRWMNTTSEADLGQCFVAINPFFFAPGFEDRMEDLIQSARNLEPVNQEKKVLIAGDPERTQSKKVDEEKGITYHINQINDSYLLAKMLNVQPMKSE